MEHVYAQLSEERPECAQALALRIEGHDLPTIAEKMNRKVSAIRDFMDQCRARFRALLEEHCPESLHIRTRS